MLNQTIKSLIVTGLIILVTHNQPLLAQTAVPQSLTSQTNNETIKREILLLGDRDPTVRKNARIALESMGVAAISELEKAAKFETTKDYETQIIAAKILTTLQNSLALDQAKQFTRGEKELEGWPAFKELVGDTTDSRSLFKDIYLRNREELLRTTSPSALGSHPNHTASYSQLQKLVESTELTQVCFGMFLLARKQREQATLETNAEASTFHSGPSLTQTKHLFRSLAKHNSPLGKLNDRSQTPILLVRAIIESAPQAPQLLVSKMKLIQLIKSKEISPLLLELATPEKPTLIRLKAIEHTIKIADKTTFKKLNTYLDDTTEVGKYLVLRPNNDSPNQPPQQLISQVQIRDLILLGNLRLNQQDHTEFGFREEAIDTVTDKVNVKQAGFVDNEKRKKAFERFRSIVSNNAGARR